MTSTPAGNTQRRQWMEKVNDYYEAFLQAKYKMIEANGAARHGVDGMPHGNSKSDPTAATAEKYQKAKDAYEKAKKAYLSARLIRCRAMRPLNQNQEAVVGKIYLFGKSRREVAKELHRSDFWVRAQERTGLFLLELPSGWELDILP